MEPGEPSDPGQWYGEYLWRINFVVPDTDALFYRICAIDAAGNKACTPVEEHLGVTSGSETDADGTDSTSSDGTTATSDGTDSQVSAIVSDSLTGTESNDVTNTDASTSPGTVGGSTAETGADMDSASVSDTEPTGSFDATSLSDGQSSASTTASDSGSDSVTDGFSDGNSCGCRTDGGPAWFWLGLVVLVGRRGRRR